MYDDKTESRLISKKITPTPMRVLILQYLMGQDRAVSLQSIEREFVRADKSTLYRTLKTFEKNKLVHSIDDGTKQLKYALCLESCECLTNDLHYHFHCTVCENTFCLTDQNIPQIELPKNFSMEQANMVIKGRCAACHG